MKQLSGQATSPLLRDRIHAFDFEDIRFQFLQGAATHCASVFYRQNDPVQTLNSIELVIKTMLGSVPFCEFGIQLLDQFLEIQVS